jgi:hypothetical protein
MGDEKGLTTDARVERLWKSLDTRGEGQLDLNGLKRGLKNIDHRASFPFMCGQTTLLTRPGL